MDINKTLADLKTATNDEIAVLFALLKEDGNALISIIRRDMLNEIVQKSSDPVSGPPGSTYPPAP